MSSSSLTAVRDDGRMSSPGPRSGGPTSRRSFTSAQKLDHLAAYGAAAQIGQGGAYLRSHGLYSSLISEWRRLRDAGVLAGKKPGEKIGRLTGEQAEIARLSRQLDKAERRLATTQAALGIMGKAHELLEVLTKSSQDDSEHTKHCVNGQVEVPAGGQLEVPTPLRLFSSCSWVLLGWFGLRASGRTPRW